MKPHQQTQIIKPIDVTLSDISVNTSLFNNIIHLAITNQKCNIIIIDNIISDAKGLKRMITKAELQELNKKAA